MSTRDFTHLLNLNLRIADGEPLTDALRAELQTTVQALRQQRASALAASEARVTKANRPVRDAKPDSYAPVDLHISSYKVRIGDNQSVDEFADRLAACWNFCLGVPLTDLVPGGATNFVRDH